MVAIPFPSGSAPGHRPQESAGRLINCFAEPLGEGRSLKHVRVPGLTPFLTSDQTGFRGMTEVNGVLYVAFKDELYRGTAAGGAMTRHDASAGQLPGTAPVYFARNNNSPPDIIVVTEENAKQIIETPSHDIVDYIPVGLPDPTTVFSLDGYIIFPIDNGEIYATGLNNLVFSTLSTGEAVAKPDGLVRGVAFGGRALFFGSQSLEIWIDVGATPFPLQRGTVVPFGLIGPDAVAGWEDGFGSGLLWVADDCTVRLLDGYTPVKVSTPDLDRLLSNEPDKASLLANVYVVDGHPMWTITGSSFSWSFDLSTKKWHERKSWRELTSPGHYDFNTKRWRGLQTVRAFDRWLIGDRNSGNIYSIDPAAFREHDDPLPMRIESAPVAQFPQRVRVARADFHMRTGVGITPGTATEMDPTVEVSWSDDGGEYWSNPLFRKMGRQSRTETNISVFRTGMSTRHGRRWRLDISDPVYVALFGGDQAAELRVG